MTWATPGHRQQPRLDDPVGRIAQLIGIDLVGQQADLQQVHGARDQRRELRRPDARRQAAAQLGQALGDALTGNVHVDVVGERDGDDRETRNGLGAQRRKPARTIDGILDRLGDELLDLLGGKARRFGLDCRPAKARTPEKHRAAACSAIIQPSTRATAVSAVAAPKCRTQSATSARIGCQYAAINPAPRRCSTPAPGASPPPW